MFKEMPLEESLLSGFEFPVALVVEVTKQGVVLSKQRYSPVTLIEGRNW